jgi:hypothetical protein
MNKVEEIIYIDCLGEDRKLHKCEPHSDKTYCGINVIKKKLTDKDRIEHYSCYECTY